MKSNDKKKEAQKEIMHGYTLEATILFTCAKCF